MVDERGESTNSLYNSISRRYKIAVAVILILFIASIVILFNQKEEQAPVQMDSHDVMLEAINSGNVTSCDSLGIAKRDICRRAILGTSEKVLLPDDLIKLAAQYKDPIYCQNITSPAAKNLCLSEAGVNSGVPTNSNPNSQTTSTTTRNQADEDAIKEASTSGDTSGCSTITDPVKRDLCYYEGGQK